MTVKLIPATAKFGTDLLSVTTAENAGKNVILSPLSISTALGLAAAGARGTTLEAMNKVLGLPDGSADNNAKNNETYANLLFAMVKSKQLGVRLSIANSIWARGGVKFRDEFILQAMKNFAAEVKTEDFADPETLEAMNRWVRINTEEKIDKIIDKIGVDAAMYILNAIYFKGSWSSKFDKRMTDENAIFHAADGDKRHPLMFKNEAMRYVNRGAYQLVALPFGEHKRVHLYIILPRSDKTIEEIVASLDGNKFFQENRSVAETEGMLWLPRFQLDYKVELKDPLTKLGMGEAFHGANFSGMREENDLHISRVIHRCKCAFDEEGGELAGATAVEITLECVGGGRKQPWRMRVDSPFIAILADEPTGTIIGAGIVNNP